MTKTSGTALAGLGLMGVARDSYPRDGQTYSFVAGFAEVEVDVETGVYQIVDYLAVADVGTVLHPRSLGGQILGGAIQGMSHTRSQKLVYDTHYGVAIGKRMYHNKPPTILDIPIDARWEAVNIPDPGNPVVGAKGVGEPAVGNAGAAVLCALADAVGYEIIRRTPVQPEQVMAVDHQRPAVPNRTAHRVHLGGTTMPVIRDVMPAFELFQPTSIADTVGLLDRHDNAWLMAGGLDSFDWWKDRIKRPAVVIDLGSVAELRGIKEANGGLEIAANTSLTEIANHQVVRDKFGLLAQAAGIVASPQIRNQGSIGGNVSQDTRCHYYRAGWPCYRAGGNICYADTPTAVNREHAILDADRCVAVSPSDTAPALIALDAQMVVRNSGGERVIPAQEYFVGPERDITRMTALGPRDLLTAIRIPVPSRASRSISRRFATARSGTSPWSTSRRRCRRAERTSTIPASSLAASRLAHCVWSTSRRRSEVGRAMKRRREWRPRSPRADQ